MTSLVTTPSSSEVFSFARKKALYCFYLLFGTMLPLGFAPFHLPGMAIIGMAFFYYFLCHKEGSNGFLAGIFFGLGYFGFGISWVYVSIHEYGHLHPIIAALATFSFIFYLSLFTALFACIFIRLSQRKITFLSTLIFSASWILVEYLRSKLFTGFPWLLLGFGQFDSPIKFLLPILGVYGGSFFTCLAAGLLVQSIVQQRYLRYKFIFPFMFILLSPLLIQSVHWVNEEKKPIHIGIVQANLSMRDKWDEALFWQLLDTYEKDIVQLLGTDMIVLPESAIPLPASYISDVLQDLNAKALKAGSSILLGIPKPSTLHDDQYYNALISLGAAKGDYVKQHLVPFGEYIPAFFQPLMEKLNIPDTNLKAGLSSQRLVKVHHHPIATVICYELAYGELLRQQFPSAEWIVSISDDGWFGHSFAMYQQQQIAQVRSLQTGRYQVMSNNDGLSSVIDGSGQIIAALPAFSAGLLKATIYPVKGTTPWLTWGDAPVLILAVCLLFFATFYRFRAFRYHPAIAARHKRGYP